VDALLGGSGLAGAAATLADGRLVLILSPSELVRRSGLDGVLPTPVLELEEGK
jgi:chemotaxis protein histidine kinase CheA